MRLLKATLNCLMILSLSSCGDLGLDSIGIGDAGGGGGGGEAPSKEEENKEDLREYHVGNMLMKRVPFFLNNDNLPNYEIEYAFMNSRGHFIIPVRNSTGKNVCQVVLKSVEVQDRFFEPLGVYQGGRLNGSVLRSELGSQHSTCLRNGEKGYFIGFQHKNIARVARLESRGLAAEEQNYSDPSGSITTSSSLSDGVIEVNVKNNGNNPVQFDRQIPVIFFDGDGDPFDWSVAYFDNDNNILEPGKEITVRERLGTSKEYDPSSIQAYVTFLDLKKSDDK